MPTKKPTKKPNNPMVLVKAFPTGKLAKRIATDAEAVFISTFTEREGDDVLVTMCGFSNAFDRSNAFELRFLNDVLNQWEESNGKGWNFVLVDKKGEFCANVTKEKARR